MVSKLLFTVFLSFVTGIAFAQEESGIKELTAYLAESLPEAEDLSDLTTRLSFYKEHPIDLNDANPDQLKELIFLSALQISNFFSHIHTNGKLKDLLELQSIDGFDVETITRLLPFVILKPESEYHNLNFRKAIQQGNNELTLRYGQILEQQKGFRVLPGSRYLGSPAKMLLKYKYNYNNFIAASFVAEKDAGESFFSGINKSGFDFISGSLAIYQTSKFKKIVLGDYSLQFGQGLTLWSGTSLGKGPDVAGVAKKDTGLKPYTSANESSFFRGTGITFNILKNIDITTFISFRSLDASLTKNAAGNYNLSTISVSGLHRTVTETGHKKDLDQLLYGAVLEFNKDSFSAGIIGYHSSYQHEFTTGKLRYKKYGLNGKELTNLGFHYNYTFKSIYFFTELAQSNPGGPALLNGVMASLSSAFSAVLLYRNYAKNHINFYSQAMGEGAAAANEKGIYGGINISPNHKWNISVYSDLFWFPWAKYRIDEASSGYDLMGQVSYSPRKTFKAMLRFKTKQTAQNESSALPVNPLQKMRKDIYRLQVQWKLNRKISMQNRLEITRYQKGPGEAEYGYMIYQDADYHPMSSRISANIRFALFNTPSYNSRIYAYEDDVLYGSGSGLYSGKGIRSFLNLSYSASRQLRIWIRYAVFHYAGKDKTGSGLDEINGNMKSDIKIQLRYKF